MDCKRVERLLPYLADPDAGDGEAAAARAHVAGCERCAGLADELRATVDLVREFSEPEADAAFYAAIRRDVLARVASERPARAWARPLAVAASVALAALALALAVWALGDRAVAPKPLRVEAPPDAPPPAPTPEQRPERVIAQPKAPRTAQVAYRSPARPRRRAADSARVAAPPASGEPLRIEYQTSDPSVRIIWFVPAGGGASPDTAKSGD